MTAVKHNTSTRRPRRDISGQSFGRLIVQHYISGSRWECLCVCGRVTIVPAKCLIKGTTKSCGCLKRDLMRGNSQAAIHGLSLHPIYKRWRTMLQRCYDPDAIDFYRYGGRGITVCERWRYSVENFYADMGDPPRGMTLERKNNQQGYSAENCVWATHKEQQRNMRSNHLLTYNGETHPVIVWAEKFNLSASIIYKRIHAGWSVEKSLTTPQDSTRKRGGSH